jgi:hypothetical protein
MLACAQTTPRRLNSTRTGRLSEDAARLWSAPSILSTLGWSFGKPRTLTLAGPYACFWGEGPHTRSCGSRSKSPPLRLPLRAGAHKQCFQKLGARVSKHRSSGQYAVHPLARTRSSVFLYGGGLAVPVLGGGARHQPQPEVPGSGATLVIQKRDGAPWRPQAALHHSKCTAGLAKLLQSPGCC